jgi:hypothetical protein
MANRKKNTDKSDGVKMCEKHNTEMVRTFQGSIQKPVYDQEGNQIDEKEENIYIDICPECEFEQKMAEYGLSDLPDVVEKSIREYQQSPFRKPIEKPKDKDFIRKYSGFIASVKSVPQYIAEAACVFLISIALYQANYTDAKGRVLSNVAFRHIAESGHNKSPLYNLLIKEVIPKAFSDYEYYITGRGTSRGITSMVQKEKSGRRIQIVFARDEDSVLYKADNYNRDMFEGYSDLFDGNIPSNTTNMHGHQTDRKCVCSYWSAGTPISIKYVDPDNFQQGWQWRHFPLMDDSPIPEDILNDKDLTSIKEMTEEMIAELREMTKIRVIRTTPDFMRLLNAYYLEIIKEKNEVEKRKKEIGVLSIEWVETESKTKAPEHIIKFAMIHAASRWNLSDDGTLIMDTADFLYAKEKFEFYRSHIISFFKEWIEQREPMELSEKMNRIIEIIRSLPERYEVELIQKGKKGEYGEKDTPEIWEAILNPKGEYVSRSKVLWKSHLQTGSGWNSFDTVIDTLIQSEKIIQRHASVKYKFKNKSGKEVSGNKPMDLFKLTNH